MFSHSSQYSQVLPFVKSTSWKNNALVPVLDLLQSVFSLSPSGYGSGGSGLCMFPSMNAAQKLGFTYMSLPTFSLVHTPQRDAAFCADCVSGTDISCSSSPPPLAPFPTCQKSAILCNVHQVKNIGTQRKHLSLF